MGQKRAPDPLRRSLAAIVGVISDARAADEVSSDCYRSAVRIAWAAQLLDSLPVEHEAGQLAAQAAGASCPWLESVADAMRTAADANRAAIAAIVAQMLKLTDTLEAAGAIVAPAAAVETLAAIRDAGNAGAMTPAATPAATPEGGRE